MSYLEGVVYDPPSSDYPPLIVIFKPGGEVLAVRSAETVKAAEDFLAQVMDEVQSSLDAKALKNDFISKQ